ncbi:MAG: TrbC/VirB2 family protein [Patescibacteria group bacterium]
MKKTFARVIPLALPFFLPLAVFAAGCEGGTAGGLCNPLGYDSLWTFLERILKLIVEIGFPVIVLYIVFIGFKFITASGKPEELAKVRSLFFWAIIGALVVLGAQALALAIQATVNDIQQGI